MEKNWKKLDPILMATAGFVILISLGLIGIAVVQRLFQGEPLAGFATETRRLIKIIIQLFFGLFFVVAIYLVLILLDIQAILEKK